jgi:hypothetical protein
LEFDPEIISGGFAQDERIRLGDQDGDAMDGLVSAMAGVADSPLQIEEDSDQNPEVAGGCRGARKEKDAAMSSLLEHLRKVFLNFTL